MHHRGPNYDDKRQKNIFERVENFHADLAWNYPDTEKNWPVQEKDKEGNIQSEAENENEQNLFEKEKYRCGYDNKQEKIGQLCPYGQDIE